jgi:hypothetical protein
MATYRRLLGTRWRLLAAVLPAVLLVGVAKCVVTALGLEDIEINPLYTGLVAGNIFLLGFLLSGVLSDFKEAEKLPVELTASLESISDEFIIVKRLGATKEGDAGLRHISATVDTVLAWLYGRITLSPVLAHVSALNNILATLDQHTQATYVNRMKAEQNAARRMVMRINAIRVTSFVAAGFMVAALTSVLLITVLLFIDVGPYSTDAILICTLTFLLTYVLLLVRDLDNPFEYAVGEIGGSAEVSLEPLVGLQSRLAAHID